MYLYYVSLVVGMILARKARRSAFFFFFSPASSNGYEDPLFVHFCGACARVRKAYPSLTASACRTLLSVVVAPDDSGLSYGEIATLSGLEYIQAVQQIEMLSSGRSGKDGLGLLTRLSKAGKVRFVTLSREGIEFARFFAPQFEDATSNDALASQIAKGPLPGFQCATRELPSMTLGTLAVLLQVALRQRSFGIEGVSSKTIADDLEISNFPRHLAILGDGLGERPGYGLIRLRDSAKDRRVKLPELTDEGHRVVTSIAAAVTGRAVDPPKRVKPEVLEALDSPNDMSNLEEDDYISIVWDTNSDRNAE